MIKASALYIVIIIALVIGLLCSALIVAAYFYKNEYQKKFRYDQLQNNLNSGVNILVVDGSPYLNEKTFSLFNTDADSVSLQNIPWGVYDIGIAKAFIQKDTLYKTFSIGSTIDSAKWAALYIIDEDRSLSLSGKTTIRGDAYMPKAGVTTAYVDNKSYEGDKRLVIGTKHESDRKLPPLSQTRLALIQQLFLKTPEADSSLLKNDSLQNSFLTPARVASFGKRVKTIKNIKLGGNIILYSDTTIVIDSTASLNNILVFAKAITVKSGFHGTCQLFASDSISVERNCRFDYPSCLGVLRFETAKQGAQEKLSLGENCVFNGIAFTYEQQETALKPIISLGKNNSVTGQIYSQGIVKYLEMDEVHGSVFTAKFLFQSLFTLYENYLINIKIDSKALSPYYLTSELLPVAAKRKKVLQWLEAN